MDAEIDPVQRLSSRGDAKFDDVVKRIEIELRDFSNRRYGV